MPEMKHEVFISFSFSDQELADKIVNHLTNIYGIPCWICTEEIKAGENYRDDIEQAIECAKLVVLVQSQASSISREVKNEILYAIDSEKTVMPFIIEESKLGKGMGLALVGAHYIDATRRPIEDRIRDLARDICRTLGRSFEVADGAVKSDTAVDKLISTPPVMPKNVFCGRDDVLSEIDASFKNDERVLFLSGIGGIGKTQIVKQYAKQYKKDYDVIVYATYGGSIKDLIISETPFELEPEMVRLTLSDGTLESDEDFFMRKLAKIRKCANERTLIIIDNFDVEDDEYLPELIEGKYRLLITTRCDYSKLYPTIKIEPLDSMEQLISVFMQNYDGYEVEEDDPDLIKLIELVNRHTYTIELLAQHMENSGQTAAEMVSALQEQGIMSLSEEVRQTGAKTQVAYENLLKMFKVFGLTEEEKRILKYLSVMPIDGVAVKDFKYLLDLDSVKLIKKLENKSWITHNVNGITLHPIIREVIRHEIPVNTGNSADFIARLAELVSPAKAWHMIMSVKEYYAQIFTEVLKSYSEINETTLPLYKSAQALFSFSVNPEAAVDLMTRIYEYSMKIHGEMTYETGYAAFKTGWTYHYNMQLENSLDNALMWLLRGFDILKNIDLDTPEKNAYLGQLLGNISRMYILKARNGDNDILIRAKEFAELAIEVTEKWLKPGDPQYPKVAGAYLQLSTVCSELGDFEYALKLSEDAYNLLCPLFGEDDSDTHFSLVKRFYALCGLEKYNEAISLAEDTLIPGYSKFCGELHIPRYEVIVKLIECYRVTGNNEKADKLHTYAVTIAEKIFSSGSEQLEKLNRLKA